MLLFFRSHDDSDDESRAGDFDDEDDVFDDDDVMDSLSMCSSLLKLEQDGVSLGHGGRTPNVEPGKFQFELKPHHVVKSRLGRKVFRCDICMAIYRHAFSLKRHYIRNHINYQYVTKSDLQNCQITGEALETVSMALKIQQQQKEQAARGITSQNNNNDDSKNQVEKENKGTESLNNSTSLVEKDPEGEGQSMLLSPGKDENRNKIIESPEKGTSDKENDKKSNESILADPQQGLHKTNPERTLTESGQGKHAAITEDNNKVLCNTENSANEEKCQSQGSNISNDKTALTQSAQINEGINSANQDRNQGECEVGLKADSSSADRVKGQTDSQTCTLNVQDSLGKEGDTKENAVKVPGLAMNGKSMSSDVICASEVPSGERSEKCDSGNIDQHPDKTADKSDTDPSATRSETVSVNTDNIKALSEGPSLFTDKTGKFSLHRFNDLFISI